MHFRRLIPTFVTLVVLGGLVAAAYPTRERWLPYVFPAPSVGGTGHPEGEAPAAGGAEDHAGHDHDHDTGNRVKLSAQAQANLKLNTSALAPQEYWRTLQIPGVVVDSPGESDRGVTTRLAGVVTEIKARPGDTVRAGDPLFTLQLVSEFVQSTQAELARAAQELRIAAAKRDRTADLVKLGTQSGATLTEDEAQVKRFTVQVQAARRQLQALGLSSDQVDRAEQGGPVTEVMLMAPARVASTAVNNVSTVPMLYEVQELKVQLGDHVLAGQTLCTLANHQRLFVEGQAFKSEATALARATEHSVPIRAEFADEAPGEWPVQAPLTIHHLSNQVDPVTRTFAFYLPLANVPRTFVKDGRTLFVWRYRPGQRVRLRVPIERLGEDVFVLPAAALVREGAEAYVFRQNGNYFERKSVRVLYEDRTEVVLAPGGEIGVGQFVVRNNAAAINRAIKAAAGGGGHEGHDHAGHSHDH